MGHRPILFRTEKRRSRAVIAMLLSLAMVFESGPGEVLYALAEEANNVPVVMDQAAEEASQTTSEGAAAADDEGSALADELTGDLEVLAPEEGDGTVVVRPDPTEPAEPTGRVYRREVEEGATLMMGGNDNES